MKYILLFVWEIIYFVWEIIYFVYACFSWGIVNVFRLLWDPVNCSYYRFRLVRMVKNEYWTYYNILNYYRRGEPDLVEEEEDYYLYFPF